MEEFNGRGESVLSRNLSLFDNIVGLFKDDDLSHISDSNLYEIKFYLSSVKSEDEVLMALIESIKEKIDAILKMNGDPSACKEIATMHRLIFSTKMYIETSVEPETKENVEDEADYSVEFQHASACEQVDGAMNADFSGEDNSVIETLSTKNECEKATPVFHPVNVASGKNSRKSESVTIDAEMLNEFVVDSVENINESESALLILESEPSNIKAIDSVFRAFHTIKGSSAYLGFNYMSDLAHHAESLLAKIKEGKIAINGYYSDLLLNSVDMIKKMIENAQNGLLSAPDEYEEILNLLINSCDAMPVQPLKKSQAAPADVNKPASETGSVPTFNAAGVNQASTKAAISAKADSPELETIKITDNENRHLNPSLKPGQENDSTIRVKTDKVDRLIDAVGELVILNSMIFQDPVLKTSKNYELYKKITQAVKMVRELQDISMSMRMIQFKGLFQKMTRLVRDTAKKSNKNIEFLTYGSESEVDRNLVDIIDSALIHLLRNSIDHGIESPQERLQAGKPEKGTVKLSAFHEGGNVVIEVADDGAGLNAEKILSKALSKGIIKTSSGLSESEIYNLIFTPGFSTADTVTDISGRGVGMDVVKTSIEKLKGRIEISSQKGRGSKFTLRMPLTLALTDGMLVRVGEHKFIIPVLNVQLTFQAEASKISKFEARQEMVTHQGRTLPIFKLGEIFNITDAVSDISKGMVIVVNDGKAMSGFLVDEIIGQQQIVAKSLDGEIKNVAGISGGTILSNGRVGLIIDVLEALKLARKK